jgi:hypothetical protein
LLKANAMKKELLDLDAKMQSEAEEENRDDFHLQFMMQLLLVNPKITSFHFPPGLNLDSGDGVATNLWHSLLRERPSDLHTIVCKCDKYKSWDVRPFFNSLVPAFPKLEVLQVGNFKCTDQDLHIIAEKLTKLRSASILQT